ncbi:hypothetical protein PPERSA_08347 [Pseudocohnilembus persalinus]|uniref:Proteasome subunit beta n=1 Tax=Pseudocohnilembus persalinus TaxID=266149 RepID=A0A0V0QPP8_PSEPJ|nr:hypothetical protein PPERSA_08347 [Pseudocohnilembus persalinus]|eukprot:KRX04132.1 hypothetical protein PPERSA_08347 [Pseudocohnilembus persalinus]
MDTITQPSLRQQQTQDRQEDSTGTTIVALSYNGGVIVAADTRTSSGSYVSSRVTDKLDYVHDRIYCLRSGSAADTQTLAKYVRYYTNMHSVELNKLPHVKTIAQCFGNFMYEYKDVMSASIIVAGWDPYNGGQVFSVPPGGSVMKSEYALGGSGSGYIQSLVDDNFKTNMSHQEARELAIKAVSHAKKRDGSSGGCVRLVNITKDSVDREFFDYNGLKIKD